MDFKMNNNLTTTNQNAKLALEKSKNLIAITKHLLANKHALATPPSQSFRIGFISLRGIQALSPRLLSALMGRPLFLEVMIRLYVFGMLRAKKRSRVQRVTVITLSPPLPSALMGRPLFMEVWMTPSAFGMRKVVEKNKQPI